MSLQSYVADAMRSATTTAAAITTSRKTTTATLHGQQRTAAAAANIAPITITAQKKTHVGGENDYFQFRWSHEHLRDRELWVERSPSAWQRDQRNWRCGELRIQALPLMRKLVVPNVSDGYLDFKLFPLNFSAAIPGLDYFCT